MYAVIMAGGKGTRFWPLSRTQLPKHLINITGKETVIRETVNRILPLFSPERILVVTAQAQADLVKKQLPEIPKENIIAEPVGRNTAPCIALAAAVIGKRAGDEVMVCLPADHIIQDEDEFRRILQVAIEAAQAHDALVTIGIEPTGPETGYGYLEQGDLLMLSKGRKVYAVRSMREKPPREEAERMIAQGGFYWNSGMFIWRKEVIWQALANFLPEIKKKIEKIIPQLDTEKAAEAILAVYENIEPISIDYGVMEKAKNTLLVPGNFGWSDVGSWDALWEVSPKDEAGNVSIGVKAVVSVGSTNCLVHAPGKLVSLVEVDDVIVVETADALLICRRGSSQQVKKAVETIEGKGWEEFL
ncbi:MAG TPA: mannose-1-phosphate guanylyltransferase [Syntrophales bacterium]|nr:mannose-1-phosphate guanylyltransferase [Syntrophales bacterium]HOL59717.1 mannose-1-phosphate guanylyltransferase [Syntrophales bacterium]HPO35863.1 mannose-1-phosphate guanylyltransferase [Syntrophales bacterium]